MDILIKTVLGRIIAATRVSEAEQKHPGISPLATLNWKPTGKGPHMMPNTRARLLRNQGAQYVGEQL